MEKKNRSYIATSPHFFNMVYMEETFFPRFFALYYQKSVEFLSLLVFHTVLWTTVFHAVQKKKKKKKITWNSNGKCPYIVMRPHLFYMVYLEENVSKIFCPLL